MKVPNDWTAVSARERVLVEEQNECECSAQLCCLAAHQARHSPASLGGERKTYMNIAVDQVCSTQCNRPDSDGQSTSRARGGVVWSQTNAAADTLVAAASELLRIFVVSCQFHASLHPSDIVP